MTRNKPESVPPFDSDRNCSTVLIATLTVRSCSPLEFRNVAYDLAEFATGTC